MGLWIPGEMCTVYTTIGALQAKGEAVAVIDLRHALCVDHFRPFGVDGEKLLVSGADNWTQACEVIERLAKSGAVAAIYVLQGVDDLPASALRALARSTQTALFFV